MKKSLKLIISLSSVSLVTMPLVIAASCDKQSYNKKLIEEYLNKYQEINKKLKEEKHKDSLNNVISYLSQWIKLSNDEVDKEIKTFEDKALSSVKDTLEEIAKPFDMDVNNIVDFKSYLEFTYQLFQKISSV
ncbi:variable surface lipoprotein [Metamycoplasma buccale]|uniref:variable surface lipoprotein n=1 Tax=Metamycoplasma buccale TaxID=55602 RepID=UPI00398EF7C2